MQDSAESGRPASSGPVASFTQPTVPAGGAPPSRTVKRTADVASSQRVGDERVTRMRDDDAVPPPRSNVLALAGHERGDLVVVIERDTGPSASTHAGARISRSAGRGRAHITS